MPDSTEKGNFEVIRTPDQMIADAIQFRQLMLEDDLQTQSYFVRNSDGWSVIYKEDAGYEMNSARDDDVIALLRLAEGVMSLNKKPINPEHEQISFESFFKKTISDKENFGSLHTQMSYDPLLTCTVLARLEDIFEIPVAEKVFSGIQSEFIDRPDITSQTPKSSLLEKDESRSANDSEKPKLKRFTTIITLGTIATVTFASCGIISNNTDSADDTLAPLIEPTASINVETSTTVAENICGDVTVVNAGENLIEIAKRCNKSVEQIALWNGIDNVNIIEEGQVLMLVEPIIIPVATTILPETTTTTIVIEESTTTTVAPSVTIEATVPISETTVPPLPLPPPNDGVLTKEQCDEKGGIQYRFKTGQNLWGVSKEVYGLQADNQVAAFLNSSLIDEYRIRQILASTEGMPGAECLPKYALVEPLIPAPIIKTSSTP